MSGATYLIALGVKISMAMVIDAMDLLYNNEYDAFVLVSSDSDFTPLAIKLHESGVYVYGVGKRNTSDSFKKSLR